MMKPTIGRIVHYVETRPDEPAMEKVAIITGISAGAECDVDLHVFQPMGEPVIVIYMVPYSDRKLPGSWHYPERV